MSKSCSTSECGGIPRLRPVLVYRAPKQYEPCGPCEVHVQAPFCVSCADAMGAAQLDTESMHETVREVLLSAGRVEPDWTRTTLRWLPWED